MWSVPYTTATLILEGGALPWYDLVVKVPRGTDCNVQWVQRDTRVVKRVLTLVTPPQVVKVLHGADSDVQWLQRDFGIFVANLFDTGQAARVLQLASFGLAHLLSHFCDVKAAPRAYAQPTVPYTLPYPTLPCSYCSCCREAELACMSAYTVTLTCKICRICSQLVSESHVLTLRVSKG